MGVNAADDNASALGHAGTAVPLGHEPGQARTGRAGGHTSDKAWSHKLVSGHTSPSGRVHLHTALSGRPTAPGMTPRSGRFRVRPVRQDQPHHQGPPPSSLAVQVELARRHGCVLELVPGSASTSGPEGRCSPSRPASSHPGDATAPRAQGEDSMARARNGTAGEDDRGSGLMVTAPAEAMGEARPGRPEPRWQHAAHGSTDPCRYSASCR